MAETLTWDVVDTVAEELGAQRWARLKWRQRGVPYEWRVKITQRLMSQGVPISLGDFDRLGKLAA